MLAFYNTDTARVAEAGGLDQAVEPAYFRVKAEVLEIVCVCVCVCVRMLCFKSKNKNHRHFRIYLFAK